MKVRHLFLIAFASALSMLGAMGCRTDTPTLGQNTQIIDYTPEIDRRESAKACAVALRAPYRAFGSVIVIISITIELFES